MSDVKIISQRTYWATEGTRPADEQMDWVPRQKPPSAWFDWFMYSTYKDIEDLALFVQRFGMSRELGPSDFEMSGEEGAYIDAVGEHNVTAIVFAAGEKHTVHRATRVAKPDGSHTWVKVVWGSGNIMAGKNAYFELSYKETAAGEQRVGSVYSTVIVASDSELSYGQNETWFDLGELHQGRSLDLWLTVDATQAGHTLGNDVCVFQVIVDPEEAV